jgi:hypothetical protein
MKLKFLSKPPYLKPDRLQDGDLITIKEEPYIKEDGKFGPRGYAVSDLDRTGERYTVPFNTTSWDRLVKAFGDDSQVWPGKKVKATLEMQTIRGEQKQVVFWSAWQDPQKNLTA